MNDTRSTFYTEKDTDTRIEKLKVKIRFCFALKQYDFNSRTEYEHTPSVFSISNTEKIKLLRFHSVSVYGVFIRFIAHTLKH